MLPKKIKKNTPLLHIVDYRKKELLALSTSFDAIIALSPWAKACYDLNGVYDSRLVRQGTEMAETKKNYTKKDLISICFIGRMYPIKGIHLLLDALNAIDNSAFQLKIIYLPCDKCYLNQIEEKASHLKIACQFFADQSPIEVEKHLEQSDILCLPSIVAEMAPLVILEAFAKGVPVIGANHGGIKDMISHDIDGLLFENNNIKSLQHCLERIKDEPDLLPRLQLNVLPPRKFDQVAEGMAGIYQSI